MVFCGRRIAVWLLLAGYLFSVTAAASFHDHDRAGRLGPESHHRGDGHRHADIDPWHAASGTDFGSRVAMGRGEGPSACSSHDACVVCQFLSQKVLPTRPIAAACSEPLRAVSVFRLPITDVAAPVRIHHSRAPPSLA
jgi:hypothetical protein